VLQELKHTLKQTTIYGLGNISSKLVGLILLPLYTNSDYLSTSEFGILAILEITSQIIISLFSLNLSTAMMRWASEAKEESAKKSIIFTSLVTTIVISILLSLIFIPQRELFSRYFFSTNKFSNYFFLLFLTASFGIYNLIPFTIMRLREQSTIFATLNTFKFAITLLLTYYLLAFKGMRLEGVLLSQLIGQILVTVLSLPIVLKNIVFKFKFSVLREMISYGVPLVFSTIFTLIFTMSDRFVIKYFDGNTSVGIYSLGHKIASVMNMLILQSFQLGFLPIAYKKLGEPDEKKFFSKILTYYTFTLVFTALSISMFGKELIELLAKDNAYLAAYSVVPLISFAFVLKGIQYNFSLSFHYSKRTIYNAVIVVIMAIVNLVLNILFVKEYGYVGAAYSMLISMLFMMILSYYFGKHVYPIPFELSKIMFTITIGVLIFSLSYFVSTFPILPRISLKLLLLFLFPTLLVVTKIISWNELEIVREKFHRKNNA
jgi:O-antigen/teichoic acid export membrane protein